MARAKRTTSSAVLSDAQIAVAALGAGCPGRGCDYRRFCTLVWFLVVASSRSVPSRSRGQPVLTQRVLDSAYVPLTIQRGRTVYNSSGEQTTYPIVAPREFMKLEFLKWVEQSNFCSEHMNKPLHSKYKHVYAYCGTAELPRTQDCLISGPL